MYRLCELKPEFLPEEPFLDGLVRRLIKLEHKALYQFLSVKCRPVSNTDRDVEYPVPSLPVCNLRDNRPTNRAGITKANKTMRRARL